MAFNHFPYADFMYLTPTWYLTPYRSIWTATLTFLVGVRQVWALVTADLGPYNAKQSSISYRGGT